MPSANETSNFWQLSETSSAQINLSQLQRRLYLLLKKNIEVLPKVQEDIVAKERYINDLKKRDVLLKNLLTTCPNNSKVQKECNENTQELERHILELDGFRELESKTIEHISSLRQVLTCNSEQSPHSHVFGG